MTAEPPPGHRAIATLVLAALVAAGLELERGAEGPGPSPARIDVNAASPGDLSVLPGLGPSLAARIVDDRRRRGPFPTVDDLDRVPGIGPRTIERIRPHVTSRIEPN